MIESRRRRSAFAVHGIFWRRFVDFAARHIPAVFHPPLIWLGAIIFFFVARPARRSLARNLGAVLPNSSVGTNQLRAMRVFANFGWSLADAAIYRLIGARFTYELEGEEFLRELAKARGAIVLTAHMGSYDLGAAVFAEKFKRELRIVRAPEPDALSTEHVDLALQQASAGAVKVGYSSEGTALGLELLNALRDGEIISIQGDRVTGHVAAAEVTLFDRAFKVPTGPFVLAFVTQTPIYPLFIVRAGYRRYKVIARPPIPCSGLSEIRDTAISLAMTRWARVLEEQVRGYWPQWYAFTPLFSKG